MAVKKFQLAIITRNTHTRNATPLIPACGPSIHGPGHGDIPAQPNRYWSEYQDNNMVAGANVPIIIQDMTSEITAVREKVRGPILTCDGIIIIYPEFNLQPVQGSYSGAQMMELMNRLQVILNALPDDTMVIFGSVVHETGVGQYANTLLFGSGGGNLQYNHKRFMSGIDIFFDEVTGFPGQVMDTAPGVLTGYLARGVPDWDLPAAMAAESRTFMFKQTRFGFSICLDYFMGVLPTWVAGPPAQNRPNIHIVSSCGMRFIRTENGVDRNVTTDNGAVVICDAAGGWCGSHQIGVMGTVSSMASAKLSNVIVQGREIKFRQLNTKATV